MTESERPSPLGNIRTKINWIADRFIVENIDPERDRMMALVPVMIEEHKARYQFVFDWLSENDPRYTDSKTVILDAASGRGYGSGMLTENFPNSTVVGIELGGDYTKIARENYPKASYVQADVARIPLKSKSAGIVSAFEILEHLPEEAQINFLTEIARVLEKGGYCFLSVPFQYSFKKGKNGDLVRTGRWSNFHHLHEPSPAEVAKLAQSVGLEVITQLGQLTVSKKSAERAKRLSEKLPIWPIFSWMWPGRNPSVHEIPEGHVALANVFVLRKPE